MALSAAGMSDWNRLWSVLVGLFLSDISIAQEPLLRFELSIPSMGSNLDMVVYAQTGQQAKSTMDAGLKEIDRLSLILSNYDPESEISKLCNRSSHDPIVVSEDLASVFKHSQRWNRLSDGKFDITVGPLSQIWRASRKQKQLPLSSEIEAAKLRCGYGMLRFNPEFADTAEVTTPTTVQMLIPGMQLDLSGLATGYIVDRAFEKMIATGCGSILINAGGDIRVGDPPPDRDGWRVMVAGLGKESPPLSSRLIRNCAVTTSGDLYQFVEIDGRRYSHFIDPHTGSPIERRQSVTVFAETTLDADAGATALAILGIERASALFETLPLNEVVFMQSDISNGEAIRLRHLMK
jgi:thiamine biosynthesis lipoprotein